MKATPIGVLLAALLLTGLLAASPASAGFEQVATFAGSATPVKEGEEFSEEVQLGGNVGMAVNYTGAGGVEPGTIYATSKPNGETLRVARYNPDRSFSEAWDVIGKGAEETREAKGEPPYIRCGPEGDPTYPTCPARPGTLENRDIDIDVDQTSGNVYVFSMPTGVGVPAVTVYSADGSEVITRFAERAPSSDTIPQSPEKVHRTLTGGSIAVDAAGTVYVFDYTPQAENFYHRLMVFKPQTPGDYEHYVYTGQSNDVGAGVALATIYPTKPVVDASGFVYVADEETIVKYDPAQPGDPPICKFSFKKGGVQTITVNPTSGEVFFFSYLSDKVHRLSACEEGKFTELETLALTPKLQLTGMAYDPVHEFGPGRPAGILYGASPGPFGLDPVESGISALGYAFAPAEEIPPEVKSESVANVTQTTAQLEAQVDPKGSETTYVFQYITDAAFKEAGESFTGAAEAPLGGGSAGHELGAVSVSASLFGLAPDTAYHYRAIATSHCAPPEPEKVCEDVGPEQSFRTFPIAPPGLPDQRAYELVSPADKHGGQVLPADPGKNSCGLFEECKPGYGVYTHFPMQASPDGEAVVYEGTPFSASEGAVTENQYLSRRDPKAGWQNTNLTPPLLVSRPDSAAGYKAFDASLNKGLLQGPGAALSPEAPAGYPNIYLQPTGDPLSLDPLVRAPLNRLPGNGEGGLLLTYAGASADFSKLFFEANDVLSGETAVAPAAVDGGAGKRNLYEWVGGELRLVNVDPGNATTAPGAAFGSGTLLGSGSENIPLAVFTHAISDDGSRVFWSSESGQVYVREDGEVSREILNHTGKFLTASADGSKLLLSDGCLYVLEEETCEDLTGGKGGFEGIAGQSEDLARVYFVDTAVLSGEEENGHGTKAEAGKPNLYAWDEGATTFIATLLPDDNLEAVGTWQASPAIRTAQASPNGRWLAFLSQAPLSGQDNTGLCAGSVGNSTLGPCPEAFLYHSSTGELICPSCNPSGTRPLGPSTLRLNRPTLGSLPQPHYLADSGRLLFDSQDSLTPADVNQGVEDVYQYEPEGVGSCERAAGCVSLISAGSEGVDSNFLAMDASGANVFFTSRDQLTARDRDELIDLYVAREFGGLPSETETTRTECQGETCQPAPIVPDNRTPASSAFHGGGNLKPSGRKRGCPKGKRRVRRKGKAYCLKRPQHRKTKRNHGGAK